MTNNLQSDIFTGVEITHANPKVMIILLHGLGSNADDLISLAPLFQQLLPYDIAYVSPNAPEVFDMVPFGNAYQWFSLNGYDPSVRNFESHLNEWSGAVKKPQAKLSAFISEQQKRFNLLPKRIALLGFSQGAMVSLYASTLQEVGCVVSCSGALLAQQDFATAKELPPYLFLHGQEDDVVPCAASLKATEFLLSINAKADIHTYANLSHSINEQGIAEAAKFIDNICQ